MNCFAVLVLWDSTTSKYPTYNELAALPSNAPNHLKSLATAVGALAPSISQEPACLSYTRHESGNNVITVTLYSSEADFNAAMNKYADNVLSLIQAREDYAIATSTTVTEVHKNGTLESFMQLDYVSARALAQA